MKLPVINKYFSPNIHENLCSPGRLVIIFILLICSPYLFYLSGHLLALRVVSGVLFILSIFILAYLAGSGIVPNLILSFCALLYVFSSYCEIGNYLIKGDTFKNEFWQFVNFDAIFLSFQTAPLLASVGLLAPLIVSVSMYYALKNMRRTLGECFQKWGTFVVALVIVVASLLVNIKYSSISQLLLSYSSFSTMMDAASQRNYIREVPPRSKIQAEEGHNIIHIILESFGDIYTDNNRFPGLAPNLSKYKNEGVSATNMIQTQNQANSYMGQFSTEFGRYYFIKPDNVENEFGLGYVLKKAGYENVFLRGAGANMAGPFTTLYSSQNGYDTFISREYLAKKYDNSHISGFGFTDEILFKEALVQYKKLIKNSKPFKLTLFTLDMHGFPQMISKVCKEKYNYNGPFKEDFMVQAAHCTDTLVGEFIQQVSKLPKFEDLIIVIHSDHVQHTITPAVAPDSQKIYNVMFGSTVEQYEQNEEVQLMDVAPTILEIADIKTNAKFYAGNDYSGSLNRTPILPRKPAAEPYSDPNSRKKFTVIDTPPKEQLDSDNMSCLEDKYAKISFIKLDGAIFSSAYVFVEDKRIKPPFYVLYPLKERSDNKIQPSKGIILKRKESGFFATGFNIGVISQWKSALLKDLSSGARWEINFKDNTVSQVSRPQNNKQIKFSKQEVFNTNSVDDFYQFDQIQRIGSNELNVLGDDPKMSIDITISTESPHLVVAEVESPHKDIAKLYYEINNESISELNMSSDFLEKGENRIQFYLPKGSYNKKFRFDVGEKKGVFKFTSLKVYSLVESGG